MKYFNINAKNMAMKSHSFFACLDDEVEIV